MIATMRTPRGWIAPVLMLVMLASVPAQAAGPVGLELWGSGGYRHSFAMDKGQPDLSIGLDIRIAFLMIGGEVRAILPVPSVSRLQGLINLTLFVPGIIARPYLQLSGCGGALLQRVTLANAVARQALGVDIFLKSLGLGIKIYVDEQMTNATGVDIGLGGAFVLRFRG